MARAKPRFLAASTASKKSSWFPPDPHGNAQEAHAPLGGAVPAQRHRRPIPQPGGKEHHILIGPGLHPERLTGLGGGGQLGLDHRGPAVQHVVLHLVQARSAAIPQQDAHLVAAILQPFGHEEAAFPEVRSRPVHQIQLQTEGEEGRDGFGALITLHPEHGIARLDAAGAEQRARCGQEGGVGRDELVALGQRDDLVHPFAALTLGLDAGQEVVHPRPGPAAGQIPGLQRLIREGRIQPLAAAFEKRRNPVQMDLRVGASHSAPPSRSGCPAPGAAPSPDRPGAAGDRHP